MQQAVLEHFPTVQAKYKFTHRDKDIYFSRECFDLFVESVKRVVDHL
jgi:nicotinate phosphoribosyltransferase